MNDFEKHDYKPQTKAALFPMNESYKAARHLLLLLVALTFVNIVLSVVGLDLYLLVSLSIPYCLVSFMVAMTGNLPAEYYEGMDMEGLEFLPDAFLYAAVAFAIVVILIYGLLWLLSGKSPVAYLIATVLFAIDTAGLLVISMGDFAYYILDILFHIAILFMLIRGIVTGFKAKAELASGGSSSFEAASDPSVAVTEENGLPTAPACDENPSSDTEDKGE